MMHDSARGGILLVGFDCCSGRTAFTSLLDVLLSLILSESDGELKGMSLTNSPKPALFTDILGDFLDESCVFSKTQLATYYKTRGSFLGHFSSLFLLNGVV